MATGGLGGKRSPYDIARTLTGSREGDAAVADYLETGGQNLDPQTTAWCAAFVNSALQQAGVKGTGSNMARSFLDYGTPVSEPQRGDIAVFSRGNDPTLGHVGFFEGIGPGGKINVLGGNQANQVSVAGYDPSRLLGYRRPGGGSAVAPTTYQVGPGFRGQNPHYVAQPSPEPIMGGLGAVPEEADPQAAGREMLAGLGTPMLSDEEMLAMAMAAMKRRAGGQAAAAPQYEIRRTLAEAPKGAF